MLSFSFFLLFVTNTTYVLWFTLISNNGEFHNTNNNNNNNNNEGNVHGVHGVPNPITHHADNSKLHHMLHHGGEEESNKIHTASDEAKKEENNKGNNNNNSNSNINSNQKKIPPSNKSSSSSSSSSTTTTLPTLSLLNCDAYDGPYDKSSLDEMVYWKEIPNDWNYQFTSSSSSSSQTEHDEQTEQDEQETSNDPKYLTFDTDLSGFNNQRMVFEINIAMSISTGRILVIPNSRYIDHFPNKKTQLNTMNDFFNLYDISLRMKSKKQFQYISMNEYIIREGKALNIPTDFTNWTTTTTKTKTTTTKVNDGIAVAVASSSSASASASSSYSNQFLLNQTELRCNNKQNHNHNKNQNQNQNQNKKIIQQNTNTNTNCSYYTNWMNQKHIVHGQWKYYIDEYFHDHPQITCPSSWGASMCMIVIPDSESNNNSSNDALRFKSWMDSVGKEQEKQRQRIVSEAAVAAAVAVAVEVANTNPDGGGNGNGNERLKELYQNRPPINNNLLLHDIYVGQPIPVNANPEERIKEVYQQRRMGLCIYNKQMSNVKYYHMRDDPTQEQRLMANWYDYIFYENWKDDLWMKRFMRDQLKYNNEIQCCSARIIKSIRSISRQLLPSDNEQQQQQDGIYHSMHIRRTDMVVAYKTYNIERNSSDIYHEFLKEIPIDSIVYIATDEKDKHYFDAMRENYKRVFFLEDFIFKECPLLDIEKYGMIDQLVASKGKHFIGQYYSTFTGYINRLRGYHSQKQNQQQQQQQQQDNNNDITNITNLGIIPSWFYSPKKKRNIYQNYEPIGESLFAMEYPIGWRDIDYDI